MPIIKEINTAGAHIMVWQDKEDMNFFTDSIQLSANEQCLLAKYTNERRKKDLVIARYLVQKDYPDAEVRYYDSGKPYLKGQEAQISITHSKDIVGIIIHKEKTVGIDIEYISTRVERVKNRFLAQDELATANTTELLTTYWSAKETLFKLDDKQGIDFRADLDLKEGQNNTLIGNIRKGEDITINCIKNAEWVLTYSIVK